MKKRISAMQFLLFMPGLYCSTLSHAAQQVTPLTDNQRYVKPLETIVYRAIYDVSEPQTGTEAGIGIRVHYDSRQLSPTDIQLHPTHALPAGTPTDDAEDFDADPDTDKYIVLAWVDLNTQWPGSNTLPLDLFTINFTPDANFNHTTINLSSSGTAGGAGFQSAAQSYCVKPMLAITTPIPDLNEGSSESPRFVIQAADGFTAECGEIALNYSITGDASSGSDYFTLPTNLSIPTGQNAIEMPLLLIDDDQVETDENVTLTLLDSDEYQLNSNTSASININNDDQTSTLPSVNLSVAKTDINEGTGGSLLIYASRSADDLSTPLEVFLHASGSASPGTDYLSLPPSIIIPANQQTGFAVIILTDDGDEETTETLNLSIKSNPNYQRNSGSAVQLIINDDEITQNTNLPISTNNNASLPFTSGNAANAQITPVPTLNEWLLWLMSLLLAGFAIFQLTNKTKRQLSFSCQLLAICMFIICKQSIASESIRVPTEIFQPPANSATAASNKLRAAAKPTNTQQPKLARHTQRPQNIELGAPTSTELKQLGITHSHYKTLPVGIRRQLPALPEVKDWAWTPVNGGEAGTFIIVSEQASRLRALMYLRTTLPAGVEIRIYQPDAEQAVYGPFTQADFKVRPGSEDTENRGELWTPSISGDRLGIEIFAPDTVDKANIQLDLPRISHIVYDLHSQQFKNSGTYKLSSCDISIACAPANWQETAKSVARYIYTNSDGNSFLCSGTLINDQNTATQEPYFLTAAHCIADDISAASMDFFWLYRETSCGLNDGSWIQVSGGAELLASRTELDTTLVRMNNSPPAGVAMSGWILEDLADNESVHGIHHALGDIKQFSAGQFQFYSGITFQQGGYTATPDPQGDFTQVIWQQGVTNQGSSGSGLWQTLDSQQFLKGTLVGGSSSCATPDAPDQYSRIERFYPFATTWLGAVPLQGILDNQTGLEPLTDGIMIARYMNGVRGSALLTGITSATDLDLSTIESRLQDTVNKLDIDGNGMLEAERDGLLLIRYLFGLRGDSLIAELDLTASPNNDAADIADFIAAALAGT